MRRGAHAAAMFVLAAALVASPMVVLVGCQGRAEPSSDEPSASLPGAPQTTPTPPEKSEITWVVHAPDIGATSPGEYDLATPTTLTIEFSGPIDKKSVAAALVDAFASTTFDHDTMEVIWTGDQAATLNIPRITSDQHLTVEITPDGGLDAGGKRLTETDEDFFRLVPGEPLACWRYQPDQPNPPQKITALSQPYTVKSLSPTGDRMLLWLKANPHGYMPDPFDPGRYYLLDLDRPELVELGQEDRWGQYCWLPHGTLVYQSLLFSPSPEGTSPSWLYTAPASDGPGGQAVRWVRGFKGVTGGDFAFSADGLKAAKVAEGRAVMFDLSDQTTRVVEGVSAQPTPSGVDDSEYGWVSVAQDGRHVAYSDWTPTEADYFATTIWVADTVTGDKWSVGGGDVDSRSEWSPTGEALLLWRKGIVDLTGRVVCPCAGEGLWSPNGEVVWLRDVGLVRVSDWALLRGLTDQEPWYSEYYAWSPDGTKFAGGLQGRNLVVTAEGLTLWEDESPRQIPIWSTDSSHLVVGSILLGFDSGATHPTVTPLDLDGIGPKARVLCWSGDSLIVVTGGR